MDDLHKQIVEKHGLIPTDFTFGTSFINNVTVYDYKGKVYFAQCNTLGERTEDRWLVWLKEYPEGYKKFSSSLLHHLPSEELDRICALSGKANA